MRPPVSCMPDALRIARYRLRADVTSLSEAYGTGAMAVGDIVQRGAVAILRCPACAALQFTAQTATGHLDAPNLLKPIHCGAGTCRRCGRWFIIHTGLPRFVESP
jgi:uncharacterized protein YbaR (Trm112 family)